MKIPDQRFVDALHKRIAGLAVGPSSARNMLKAGTINDARKFLAEKVRLGDLKFENAKKFSAKLDRLTRQFQKRMKWGRTKWGAARKFLNLFLRDCTYTWQLRAAYELEKLEPLLEVPVDSHVAKKLKAEPEGSKLPRWKGVIHLDQEANKAYQEIASCVAKRRKIPARFTRRPPPQGGR